MHEVHGPDVVRTCRRAEVIAQLGLNPAVGRFVAQLQADLAIQAGTRVCCSPASSHAAAGVNTSVAIAHAGGRYLLHSMS